MTRCCLWSFLLFVPLAMADAADAPARLAYSKSFPGSTPPFVSITVDHDGTVFYNETEDPDNAEKLKLEPATVEKMFDLAAKLDYFKKPLESGLKVANMGQKTFKWENGAEKNQTTFNYSLIEDARTLTDTFENISESTRALLDLRRAMKHDRLGVNQVILKIQSLWDNKRLVATADFLPLLDAVAQNEALIHMARERSAQIADAIRGNGGK